MLRVGGKRRGASAREPGRFTACAVASGTVRFAHPTGWTVRQTGSSIIITDAVPPAETQAIEVSVLSLPPLSSTGLTLAQLVARAGQAEADKGSAPDLRHVKRGSVEIVWTEKTHGGDTPPLVMRHAWCYGEGVYAVFCYGYRLGASPAYDEIWSHLLDSIELGSPTPEGLTVH